MYIKELLHISNGFALPTLSPKETLGGVFSMALQKQRHVESH